MLRTLVKMVSVAMKSIFESAEFVEIVFVAGDIATLPDKKHC